MCDTLAHIAYVTIKCASMCFTHCVGMCDILAHIGYVTIKCAGMCDTLAYVTNKIAYVTVLLCMCDILCVTIKCAARYV